MAFKIGSTVVIDNSGNVPWSTVGSIPSGTVISISAPSSGGGVYRVSGWDGYNLTFYRS